MNATTKSQMKIGLIIVIVAGIIGLLSKCEVSEKKSEVMKYPYTFLDSKTEEEGENKMDIYVADTPLSLDTLKMFCKEMKQGYEYGTFYYVVIFKDREHAAFPNNPFTAQYGMDIEILNHIHAIYEYNRLNGYSKLILINSTSPEIEI